jgi:general secretion pathway protein G
MGRAMPIGRAKRFAGACSRWAGRARAYPLSMKSKAGSKFLFCRASLSKNRFALFRTHSSPGFTLLEMVVVLAIVGILAAIVAPSVVSALTRAREASLQQDLKIMRKLIDDYYGDKGVYPPSLKALAGEGYLRAVPGDPVNANKPEWRTVTAKEGGISDIHSLSHERGANGVPYSEW